MMIYCKSVWRISVLVRVYLEHWSLFHRYYIEDKISYIEDKNHNLFIIISLEFILLFTESDDNRVQKFD